MNNESLQFKAGLIWNTAGNIFFLFSQWLITILVVKFSGFQDAGILSLAMTSSNIFSTVGLFSVRHYQISDLSNEHSNQTYISHRIITTSFSMVLCVVFTLLYNYNRYTMFCINVFMVYKIPDLISDALFGICQKSNRLDIAGKSYFFRGITSIISFSICILVLKSLLVSLIFMAACSYIILFMYDIPKTSKISKFSVSFKPKPLYDLSKKCFLILTSSIIGIISLSFPKYYLEYIYGTNILGIYTTISAPALLLQAGLQLLSAPFVSLFANHLKDRNSKKFIMLLFKLSLSIIGVSFLSIIISYFLADNILNLVFGSEILPYINLLIPIIVWCMLNVLCMLTTSILTVLRLYKPMILFSIISLILVLLLSCIFITRFSMNGVNIALIGGLLIQTLANTIMICCKIYRKDNGDTL